MHECFYKLLTLCGILIFSIWDWGVTTSIKSSFPWKSIWKVKALLRVAFFVWATTLGKIFNFDNLRKQNVIVVEWHCMSKKYGKSIDHLLPHCEVVTKLWSMPFQLFCVA
jgi:hypothetical protein